MGVVREAVASGTFYPGDPKTLAGEIDGYLARATFAPIEGRVIGLISPHAGYVYSGQVAAYGMKALGRAAYDTVILIGPSHRAHFQGAAMMKSGKYRTPLGTVDIDEDLAEAILKEGNLVSENHGAHGPEHSLEVQLPFLQTVLGSFKLVPIVMGSQETDVCAALAGMIRGGVKALGQRVLIVGSTDLSHYYPYAQAIKLDKVVVDRLDAFDIRGLIDDFEAENCEACGRGPIVVTMMLSKALGATKGRVLKYANSGDVSGDKETVVGYTSAVFFQEEAQG
jgi:AmmeMemoRadiSam system protein B